MRALEATSGRVLGACLLVLCACAQPGYPAVAGVMELRAELTDRDGVKRPLRVCCEPQGELRGLLSGLSQLREQVSALLGPLVEQESGAGGDQAGSGGEAGG